VQNWKSLDPIIFLIIIPRRLYELSAAAHGKEATAFGTGQLPDKEGQMYFATEDKFYFDTTAEVLLPILS